MGQLENLLWHADRGLRQEAFASLEKTLASQEALFAQILNNIVDFRLTLYRHRKWNDFLYPTLVDNRVEKKTLMTMWEVVSKNKAPLIAYFEAKAKLLGLKKLSWYDVEAPLPIAKEVSVSWEEACQNIIERFATVSPCMADFAKKALSKGWVDAKQSPKKRAGGFCTGLPLLKESRIFMTYANTVDNQNTLAHELGHAFHSHLLYDQPPLLQRYPMSIAEAASTMCEMIVTNGQKGKTSLERLTLLDHTLSRYAAFNMNLHSRFLFDVQLHEERKKEYLTPDRINHLMMEAQSVGYQNSLAVYFPHFWCYKMHFYFTDVTFYNWTYTFGYLFSLGMYSLLLGNHFEDQYMALLKESGGMTMEELAKKHLDVDLQSSDFWQTAIDQLNRDIEEYVELSGSLTF